MNGEVTQETGTEDIIWSARQVIAYPLRGTTFRKGTGIITRTPAGVDFFQNKFLKDGDSVEIELKSLGILSNKMDFK